MRQICFAFVLSFSMQAHTWGQSISIGSVEEATELAFERNIDFRNYVLHQEKAEIAYQQSKSYLMPTISGSFSGQYNMDLAATPLPDFTSEDPEATVIRQIGLAYNYNAGISLYQELFNRSNRLNSKISKLSMEMESVSKSAYEEMLKEQVSLHYYTSLVAKRAIEIGQEDIRSAENIYKLSTEKFDQGLIDVITLNSSKINLNTVKQSLNANRQLSIQSVTELKKLFGMLPEDSLLFTSSLDYYLPEVYVADQLKENLSLKNAELQLQQADNYLKISQSSFLPTLSFNTYLGQQQFRDEFGLGFSNDSWTNYSYLSLNLSVPIFSGFNNSRNLKKSKFDQQVAANEKLKTQKYAVLEDQRLISDYNISLEDAKSSLENYQLYKENQLLTYQKYEEGLISLENYLRVFEDYIKAENAYLNSMSKVYSYYSQILLRI